MSRRIIQIAAAHAVIHLSRAPDFAHCALLARVEVVQFVIHEQNDGLTGAAIPDSE